MKALFNSFGGGSKRRGGGEGGEKRNKRLVSLKKDTPPQHNSRYSAPPSPRYDETLSYREAAASKGIGPSTLPQQNYSAAASPTSTSHPLQDPISTAKHSRRRSRNLHLPLPKRQSTAPEAEKEHQKSMLSLRPLTSPSKSGRSDSLPPGAQPSDFGVVTTAGGTIHRKRSLRLSNASRNPPSASTNGHQQASTWTMKRRSSNPLAGPPSAPASLAHHGGNSLGSPITSSVPLSAGGTSMDASTLAIKLNELAVAHGDGLLSNEEYRTLRQGLFESLQEKDVEVPSDATIRGVPGLFHSVQGGAGSALESQGRQSQSVSRDGHGTSSNGQPRSTAPSIRSQKSNHSHLTSLFRYPGRSTSKASSPGHDHPPSSYHNHQHNTTNSHGSDGDSLRPQSIGKARSRSPGPASLWNGVSGGGGSGTGSVKGVGATGSSASTLSRFRLTSQSQRMKDEEFQREFSAARTARSIFSADAALQSSGASGDRISLYSRIQAGDDGGASAARNTAEIKAEIATVEMERDRLLETFEQLEQTALAKSPARNAIRKVQSENMLQRKATASGTDAASSSTPLGTPARQSSLMRRLSTNFTKRRRSSDDLTQSPTTATLKPLPDEAAGVAREGAELADDAPEDVDMTAEVNKLKEELASIAAQRESMTKRYEERIAYLKSTLRSALIKEKASR